MPVTFTGLKNMMRHVHARRLYVKKLAPNDNSKNQVYFGSDFEAINIIPSGEMRVTKTGSKSILKSNVNFYWINSEGSIFLAPKAQLILYPQYPEVRFSGFLQGCEQAPSELMAGRSEGRILYLGVCDDGNVIAYVSGGADQISKEFEELIPASTVGVFSEFVLVDGKSSSRDLLLQELLRIHESGWILAKRLLKSGEHAPCRASNCGGYTLEAELGVMPNGFAQPDFLGWEIKQHGVTSFERESSGSPITLMTPEPDGGIYVSQGVEKFVKRFGYKDRLGRENRINFGGIYRTGERVERTALTLVLDGYDEDKKKILDVTKGLTLLTDSGDHAAVWTYAKLIQHWKTKHDRCAYLFSRCRSNGERQYCFGPNVYLGIGTDFTKFLECVQSGEVYYDPGIKMDPKVKRRSQFRMKWGKMDQLYRQFEMVNLKSI